MDDIRNCDVKFRKVCPRTWDNLDPTPEATVRFCQSCQQNVYFCASDAEAIRHALQGACIAKPMPESPRSDGVMLGRPEPPEPPLDPEGLARLAEYDREREKTRALRNLKYSSRNCPECGYPCPDWARTCRVCGFQIGRAGESPEIP
jgi:hypothetical protein